MKKWEGGALFPGEDIEARRTLLKSSNHPKVSFATTSLPDGSVSSIHMFVESRVSVHSSTKVLERKGRLSAVSRVGMVTNKAWGGGETRNKVNIGAI